MKKILSRDGVKVTLQISEKALADPRAKAIVKVLETWHESGKILALAEDFRGYTHWHYKENHELRVRAVRWLFEQLCLPVGDPGRAILHTWTIDALNPLSKSHIRQALPELWECLRWEAKEESVETYGYASSYAISKMITNAANELIREVRGPLQKK